MTLSGSRTTAAPSLHSLRRWLPLLWAALAALVLCAFLVGRVGNLDDRYSYGWDEGAYLSVARLIAGGYRLNGDIFFAAPPVFVYSLAVGFKLFGATVPVGRGVTLFYALIGLLATYRVGAYLGGRVGGLAAAVLLGLNPGYFLYAYTAYTDLPAIALTMLGLALVLHPAAERDRKWLAAAGLSFSLGVLTKPTVFPFGLVFVFWAVALRRAQSAGAQHFDWRNFRRALLLDALWFGFAAALPFVLWIFTSGLAIFEQVFGSNADVRALLTGDLAADAAKIFNFLRRDTGLMVLGVLGAPLLLVKRPWLSAGIVVGWAATFALQLQTPSFYHHLVVLVPWVAAFGGGLVGCAAAWVLAPNGRGRLNRIAVVLTAVGLFAYGYNFERAQAFNLATVGPDPSHAAEFKTIQWLDAKTNPDEFVLTDEPMIAFRAGRALPPSAAVPAGVAITIGVLTPEQLIAAAQDYRVRVVIVWERFKALPDWMEWVQSHYGVVRIYPDDQGAPRSIFVRME